MTDTQFNGFLHLIRHSLSSVVGLLDSIPIVGSFSVWNFLVTLAIVSIITLSVMRLGKR